MPAFFNSVSVQTSYGKQQLTAPLLSPISRGARFSSPLFILYQFKFDRFRILRHVIQWCRRRPAFYLDSDLAVSVEACVMPEEDPLLLEKPGELFPEKQAEDIMCEDLTGNPVMETMDMVTSILRGCASFGHQTANTGASVAQLDRASDYD